MEARQRGDGGSVDERVVGRRPDELDAESRRQRRGVEAAVDLWVNGVAAATEITAGWLA